MGAVMYERVLRQTLFRLGGGDPEVAHEQTLDALTVLSKVPTAVALLRKQFGVESPRTVFGASTAPVLLHAPVGERAQERPECGRCSDPVEQARHPAMA